MRSQALLGTLFLLACTEEPRRPLLPTLTDDMGASAPDLGSPDAGVANPMAPSISGVTPALASTASGTQITLTGDNFTPGSLFFVNNTLVNVMSVSKTQAVLLLPARPGVGPATITVRNPDGSSTNNTTGLKLYASQLSFSQTQYTSNGNQPRGAAFGDLNNDGNVDVILTHYGNANIFTYLGTGTGSLVLSPSGANYNAIGTQTMANTSKLVDLNNDNKLDLVVVTYSSQMHYYLGNGTGATNTTIASANYGTSSGPLAYATLDFNGDNYLDVVTANSNANNLGLFFNSQNPNNLFSSGQYMTISLGGSPNRVVSVDLDGDKKEDLVTVMQGVNGPTLAVHFGTGVQASPFTAASPPTYGTNSMNQAPQWVDLGDVNGDGKIDAVVADTNIYNIRVFLGNGTTTNTFQPPLAPQYVGNTPQQLALADFDGDGKLDLVITNVNANNVSVMIGRGDGTFKPQVDFPSINGPWGIYALDLNKDGRMDFAVVNQFNGGFGSSPGYLTTYLNNSQ